MTETIREMLDRPSCSGCGWPIRNDIALAEPFRMDTVRDVRGHYCTVCDPSGAREKVAHRAAHEAWKLANPGGSTYTNADGEPR